MPHATSDAVTNGDKPTSQTISHLTSYPVVSDAIETFKSNSYGKKSLELADGAYQKFGKPVEPYLKTPASYAAPYVSKADELGDKALGSVDGRFPIVKEDTQSIVEAAKGYAFWPYTYLTSTWREEYEKTASHNNRGAGLRTTALALVSTELRVASDFLQSLANFLGPKYEESRKKGADYVQQAHASAEQYKQAGQERLGDLQKQGQSYVAAAQDKAAEYQGKAQEKGEQAKEQAKGAKEEAQKKAQK